MKNILFIDGRNLLSKMKSILNYNNKNGDDIDFSKYDFAGLFNKVLKDIKIDRKIFYLGKLKRHPETIKKSDELIEAQRVLKKSLESQDFDVSLVGRIRGFIEKCPKGHEILVFKEKGVDVRIAVDLITLTCDKELKLAIICSSDSDLQPVIKELKKRNIEMIYLGFEPQPNKGMSFTTNRTILIRNSELQEFLDKFIQN